MQSYLNMLKSLKGVIPSIQADITSYFVQPSVIMLMGSIIITFSLIDIYAFGKPKSILLDNFSWAILMCILAPLSPWLAEQIYIMINGLGVFVSGNNTGFMIADNAGNLLLQNTDAVESLVGDGFFSGMVTSIVHPIKTISAYILVIVIFGVDVAFLIMNFVKALLMVFLMCTVKLSFYLSILPFNLFQKSWEIWIRVFMGLCMWSVTLAIIRRIVLLVCNNYATATIKELIASTLGLITWDGLALLGVIIACIFFILMTPILTSMYTVFKSSDMGLTSKVKGMVSMGSKVATGGMA